MKWKEMEALSRSVAKKIRDSSFTPDVVVALARGGLVPARAICDYLVLKNLVAVNVEHWGITAGITGKAKLTYSLNMDLTGKKVLVVDDITDTGESMMIAIDHVKEQGAEEIKTATLQHIKTSKYKPNYYAEELDWKWIIFPWNVQEDLASLIIKFMDEKELTAKEIKGRLKQKHGIEAEDLRLLDTPDHMSATNWIQRRNRGGQMTWRKVK